jgi:broad specificity phosphatase PhoE
VTAPGPADLPVTVHLLRHGEVDNPRGVLYGRLPGFRLSADGERMAAVAAKALADRPIMAVVSSPLERARQTADPVAAGHGLPVEIDDRLIEPSNNFEGLTVGVGDGVLGRPAYWRCLWNPFRPSWGEPYAEIADRMLAAVWDARDLAIQRVAPGVPPEIVCVSHQLPVWVARCAVEGRRLWHRPDRRQCGLASLTSFTFRGDRVVAVTYCEPAGPTVRRRAVAGA